MSFWNLSKGMLNEILTSKHKTNFTFMVFNILISFITFKLFFAWFHDLSIKGSCQKYYVVNFS